MAGSILLISDVHADIGALDQILAIAYDEGFSRRYGPVRKVVNLGDVMERGYHPGEVVDRLRRLKNVESILGNHDEAFLRSVRLSGNDMTSIIAHESYRKSDKYQDFFRGMGLYYVDTASRLYAVHGGPVDPCAITPEHIPDEEAWLFSQTWQRISDTGYRYVDASGFHYLPRDAFDVVKVAFDGPGYVIVCGHEHEEAAYRQRDDTIEDILRQLETSDVKIGGRVVEEKHLSIEDGDSYLIRLGLAGPEGYAGLYGFDRCHFGVLSEDGRELSLLSFRREG